jgi:spore coat polysaccharide biosynthesis protein SpsF
MSLYLNTINYNDDSLIHDILKWRNDLNTRINSINTNIITPDCFKDILDIYKTSPIQPYVIYYNGINVGIITFTPKSNHINSVYIGININPNYRNNGIATDSLRILLDTLNKSGSNVILNAKIKKSNLKSIKLFNKFFKLVGEDSDYYEYIY